jgi:hypothetical protein
VPAAAGDGGAGTRRARRVRAAAGWDVPPGRTGGATPPRPYPGGPAWAPPEGAPADADADDDADDAPHGPGPATPSDASIGGGGSSSGNASSRQLSDALRAAPDVPALAGLLPELAAQPRPHLISEAWVRLAQLAPRPRGGGRGGSGGGAAVGAGPGAPADAGGARGEAEAAGLEQDITAVCRYLCLLTREHMAVMQFAQLSGLLWAWARLARRRRGGGAPPAPPALLAAAAERAAACPTAKEEAGAIPGAPVLLGRLAWGAASLGLYAPPLWRKVATLAAALAPAAGPWEAANLMWALARAGALEGAAAAALAARTAALGPVLGPVDLANIVWALGAARERRGALLPPLVLATVRLQRALGPAEVAAAAWGFARLWRRRRAAQLRWRGPLLRALRAAAGRCYPKLGVRQAATVAWALVTLAPREEAAGAPGGDGGGGGGSSGAGDGSVEEALGAARGMLARACEAGLRSAPLQEVCMLVWAASKCAPPPGVVVVVDDGGDAASSADGGGASRAAAALAARLAQREARAAEPELRASPGDPRPALLVEVAAWVVAAPASELPADGVATLLWGLRRMGCLGAAGAAESSSKWGGGGGGAAAAASVTAALDDEGRRLVARAVAALVARAAALADAGDFSPSQLPRVLAPLGVAAAPRGVRQQWLDPGGGRGGGNGSGGDDGAAAAARGALERLALPAAAVAGRFRMGPLADVACAYATAGLHPEQLFDEISEARVLGGRQPGWVPTAAGSYAPVPMPIPLPNARPPAAAAPVLRLPSGRACCRAPARGSASACCGRSPPRATPTRRCLPPSQTR